MLHVVLIYIKPPQCLNNVENRLKIILFILRFLTVFQNRFIICILRYAMGANKKVFFYPLSYFHIEQELKQEEI